MPNLNKCTFIGHLGRDPEIKYTPAGDAVATFSMAVSEKYKDNEHTEWLTIVCWKKLAETASKYLAKGNPVYVEGKLKTREYEGRDGTKKKVTEIIASQLVLLGTPKKSESAPADSTPVDDDSMPF
jgi:single-strand DNA-binding protein